jgi:NAD(P)H dehydrogenase (quinone)
VRVLLVHCHPDPASLVTAARDRALAGLRAAGHDVRVTDLYAEGFDPVVGADERRVHLEPGCATGVQRHADDLRWCEALVLVYPTWWSGQPAMLKGWIDRVWACGIAWELPPGTNRLRPLLHDVRRIVAITTHGSSKYVNALEGEAGKRTMTRSLRAMCSRRCRTSWIALYGVDTAPVEARTAFLDRVERRMARL